MALDPCRSNMKDTVCNVSISTDTGYVNVLHNSMVNTIMNCSWLYPLFTRPNTITRHLYNQIHFYACLVALILNCMSSIMLSGQGLNQCYQCVS